MWAKLGTWLGKGVLWLARHPEALQAVFTVVKAKADPAKTTPPPDAVTLPPEDPPAAAPGPDGQP